MQRLSAGEGEEQALTTVHEGDRDERYLPKGFAGGA